MLVDKWLLVGTTAVTAAVACVVWRRRRGARRGAKPLVLGHVPATMQRLTVVRKDVQMERVRVQVEAQAPVPQPAHGQVLVKVAAAPVNPSDYGRWRASEPMANPQPCGLEGSGVVVGSGGGAEADRLLGQRVGFLGASMAEYALADASICVPLPIPDICDGASWFVNPFTAYAIYDMARQEGATAFVHTGAASQLGQMLVRLCAKKNMCVINVVRRASQREKLRAIGAEHIVVTAEPGWETELRELVERTGAHVAFDCVAGESTKMCLSVLPTLRGVCFVYGRLSGEDARVPPVELIYGGKRVEGLLVLGSPRAWLAPGPDRTRRWREGSEAVLTGLQAGGWARTEFVDCSLEGMFPTFLKMWAGKEANADGKGFTGQKLRIRLGS